MTLAQPFIDIDAVVNRFQTLKLEDERAKLPKKMRGQAFGDLRQLLAAKIRRSVNDACSHQEKGCSLQGPGDPSREEDEILEQEGEAPLKPHLSSVLHHQLL